MAKATARRAATIREYHKTRRIERCPPGLVEGAPVTLEGLCLAADVFALLSSKKKTTMTRTCVSLPWKGAPFWYQTNFSGETRHKLMVFFIIINDACLSRWKKAFVRLRFVVAWSFLKSCFWPYTLSTLHQNW